VYLPQAAARRRKSNPRKLGHFAGLQVPAAAERAALWSFTPVVRQADRVLPYLPYFSWLMPNSMTFSCEALLRPPPNRINSMSGGGQSA
jgi:hypothetical protein